MKKRPHTQRLLVKLEEVVKEHFKGNTLQGNTLQGNTRAMAVADILSWNQICREDLAKEGDEEQKITEFSINFKHISYT